MTSNRSWQGCEGRAITPLGQAGGGTLLPGGIKCRRYPRLLPPGWWSGRYLWKGAGLPAHAWQPGH
ncbi:MAG: hypothetical protein WBO06_10170 [Gammaproteobacteria bacterium]